MDPSVPNLITMNLQLFAQDSGGEKTEEATPRRREKAREEGQVAKSTEMTTTFMLVIMFAAIRIYGFNMAERIVDLFREMVGLFDTRTVDIEFFENLLQYVVMELAIIAGPFMGLAFLVAFTTNIVQVGWHPTMKPLQPKLSNLNPMSGLRRMFSARTLVELLKSILKITIILVIVYFSIRGYDVLFYKFYDMELDEAYGLIFRIVLDMGIRIGAFFLVVALIDYLYQRYSLARKLRMSKQEIKDEYKMVEGNPEIKSRIRQRMREASMRRMMQELPQADVVITNPTHFAVAVQYDEHTASAPKVIAKGADLVAGRIKTMAAEYDIEIVENKPLARTLYYTVEIGDEIPPELYQTVAEVLAFVYTLKNKQNGGAR